MAEKFRRSHLRNFAFPIFGMSVSERYRNVSIQRIHDAKEPRPQDFSLGGQGLMFFIDMAGRVARTGKTCGAMGDLEQRCADHAEEDKRGDRLQKPPS